MEKEKALEYFVEMIKNSWTYDKMTEKEKEKLINLLYDNRVIDALKGNFDNRYKILNAIYGAYLSGIGYNGFNWREEQ